MTDGGTTQTHIDDEWHEALEDALLLPDGTSFNLLTAIQPDGDERRDQREKFKASEDSNPSWHYPHADIGALEGILRKLAETRQRFRQSNQVAVIGETYSYRFDEDIDQLQMAISAGQVNLALDSNEPWLDAFGYCSTRVYGMPDRQAVMHAVWMFRRLAGKYGSNSDSLVRETAERLHYSLRSFGWEVSGIYNPPRASFELLRDFISDRFRALLDVTPFEGQVSGEELRAYFERGLQAEGLDQLGWQAPLDLDVVVITTKGKRKKVLIPAEGFALPYQRVRCLQVHEIGRHAVGHVHGERSQLALLADHLDRHSPGEEGTATAFEQVLQDYDEFEYAHPDRELAVALARGLDGRKRDFRSTYTILRDLKILQGLEKGQAFAKARRAGENNAFTLCVRVFRGTDNRTRGVCFNKDIAYLEGNIAFWRQLQAAPEETLQYMLEGSFNIANPRHLKVVKRFTAP